ncbi:MAG: alpha/beta hydrolase, partial [Terriglobales bacterium]|jgi:fermentation-respiration switch protein FrsA (DUF1100 family)
MVAARNHDVAFIVMLAGPGVPGSELLVEQVLRISEATGMSHADAEKSAAKEREVLALIVKEKDNAVLEKELRTKLTGDASEAQLSGEIKTISSPWFRFFLTYDPATSLRKVTCPVLALNGSKDTQVSAQQNLPAIRKALEEGGNKHFEIVELAGLNHLFQTAKTGAPGEYAEIEETMSPVALDRIAGWILQQD